YGLMGNLYGKWDFTQGGVRFTPRAGLGYGMLFLARQRHSRQEGDQSESYRILAPYGLVGAELGVARFTFQADLAASFLGSGWHAPRTAGETVLGVAGYQRLRLGLSYRLLAPVSLGTQFVRRILRLGADPQGFTTTEQTDQLLGVVQFHF